MGRVGGICTDSVRNDQGSQDVLLELGGAGSGRGDPAGSGDAGSGQARGIDDRQSRTDPAGAERRPRASDRRNVPTPGGPDGGRQRRAARRPGVGEDLGEGSRLLPPSVGRGGTRPGGGRGDVRAVLATDLPEVRSAGEDGQQAEGAREARGPLQGVPGRRRDSE